MSTYYIAHEKHCHSACSSQLPMSVGGWMDGDDDVDDDDDDDDDFLLFVCYFVG